MRPFPRWQGGSSNPSWPGMSSEGPLITPGARAGVRGRPGAAGCRGKGEQRAPIPGSDPQDLLGHKVSNLATAPALPRLYLKAAPVTHTAH